MGIPRKQKPSPAEDDFLFQLDPEPLQECVTACAGIPLFLQTARSLVAPGRVKQPLKIRQRDRGLDEAGCVQSFLVLNALGGDCIEDFERLREDEGRAEMLGHAVPSCEAARHEVLKNELAAGVMPCGRLGANAASALKRLALPEKWLTARPKKMRFQIFCSPGKPVSHAPRTWLRARGLNEQLAEWIEALRFPPPVRTQVFLRTDYRALFWKQPGRGVRHRGRQITPSTRISARCG